MIYEVANLSIKILKGSGRDLYNCWVHQIKEPLICRVMLESKIIVCVVQQPGLQRI